jgi:hypothetical protein
MENMPSQIPAMVTTIGATKHGRACTSCVLRARGLKSGGVIQMNGDRAVRNASLGEQDASQEKEKAGRRKVLPAFESSDPAVKSGPRTDLQFTLGS